MRGYVGNIEKETLNNDDFRKVIYTAEHGQLVIMSLLPKEEIGLEVHHRVDQFFRVDSGEGKIIINGSEANFDDGYAAIVPAGCEHNIINTSSEKKLKLYTIYMPPQHRDGTIHKTKADALADENDHA